MRKKINAYFGNAYVRYFVLFSCCKNVTCKNACNYLNKKNFVFLIYDW